MATIRIPIRWRDLDDLGHVNQASTTSTSRKVAGAVSRR
jgi:acyl-CoA thioesterase FadM